MCSSLSNCVRIRIQISNINLLQSYRVGIILIYVLSKENCFAFKDDHEHNRTANAEVNRKHEHFIR